MKGFLKRDWYLMLPTLKFYAGLMVLFVVISVVAKSSGIGFISIYIPVFLISNIFSLCSYDEANHWLAYAAAVPGGRRDMVDARYLIALAGGLATAVTTGILVLLAGSGGTLGLPLLLGGICLLYLDILLPMAYRIGGTKSRIYLILILAITAGGIGAVGTVAGLSVGGWLESLDILFIGLAVFAAGLAGMAVSRMFSLRIMEKKDL